MNYDRDGITPSSKRVFRNPEGFLVDEDGNVLNDVVFDPRPDWRAFSLDEFMMKAHHNRLSFTAYNWGVGTRINVKYLSSEEKRLSNIQFQIDRIKNVLNIPQHVVDESKYIARRIVKQKLCNKKDTIIIALASLVISSRILNYPLTLKNTVFRNCMRDVFRVVFEVKNQLGLRVGVISIENLILKLGNELKLNYKTIRTAIKLFRELKSNYRNFIQGKNPLPLSIALLYLALARVNSIQEVHKMKRRHNIQRIKSFCESKGISYQTVLFHIKVIQELGKTSEKEE